MSINNAYGNTFFDIELEKFLLSSMLLKNGEIISDVAAILAADDFYRPEHRIIFNDIIKVYTQMQFESKPFNIMPLSLEMKENGNIEKIGGLSYLFMLMQTAHTTAYSIDYSYKIKEKAERRRLFTALEKLTLDLKDHTKSPLDIIASANSSISAFSQSQKSKRIKLSEYAKEAFSADLDKENIYSDRKTGFDNLDALQNFLPGVYVIGAQPALGKTTFAWQLAENLATHGDYCIFCSYEMSRLEMFCKSLARRAFYYDNHSTLSATDIRRKAYSENVHFARADIADSDMNLDIMEMQNETVDELLALIRPLCKNGDKAPVVFIDYLQIIPCSNKKYTKEELKISIDDTLRKLKVFQRDTGTTFFVISSFNRSNYNQSAAFEAFKESGGIEYSSDVIWALQLYVTTNFKGGKTEESKRKEIEKAKNQQPRQMVLQCLKNRFGGNYNCYFNYYSRFDYFEPCEESDFVVLNAPTEPPTISDEAGES